MSILITAGSTAGAFKAARQLDTLKPVYFGDSPRFPVPGFLPHKFIAIPDTATGTFIHEMLGICLDRNITEVHPLRHEEIVLLTEAITLFEEYGITLVFPEYAK